MIEHQPVDYLSAVSKDFFDFFKPARSTGPDADRVVIDFAFRNDHLTAYPLRRSTPGSSGPTDLISARGHRPTAGECTHLLAALVLLPGPVLALGTAGRVRRCDRKDQGGEASARLSEGVLYSSCPPVSCSSPGRHDGLRLPVSVPVFPSSGRGRRSRHHPSYSTACDRRRARGHPASGRRIRAGAPTSPSLPTWGQECDSLRRVSVRTGT